ncbi:MAG: SPOR domain-containing protein, partial [Proteobacteria bacterium]|nr:SPOR domain-containing protein [Pseudomonadota bacterium]
SVRSAIALLLTLVIVAAVLIFFSSNSTETGTETDTVIASARAKVNLKALYQEAGNAPKRATTAQKAAPVKKPVAKAPVKAKPAPVKTAATKVVAKAPAVKKPVKKAALLPTPKEIKAATPTGEKPWAINVASFSKEPPARDLARRLNKAGYNTYVTDFLKGSTRWYRVRVGFFTSRDDAVKFGKELGQELRLTSKPWPVRPQWDEISGHITK